MTNGRASAMHMAMSMRNFTLSRLFAFAALAALWLAAPQALAQNNPPGGATPRPGQGATSGASPSSLLPAPVEAGQGGLYLAAVFSAADTQPIASGLTWRIYADRPDADGIHKLVAESKDATPALALPEGDYIVHVALGLAGAMKRVTLRGEGLSERLALNAGGVIDPPHFPRRPDDARSTRNTHRLIQGKGISRIAVTLL